jgi:predicted dehydrogenase
MKQVLRKGLKDIVVDEVPDPVVIPHHVLICPAYSLISSGTETASLHQGGVLREVADNPAHLRKVLDTMKVAGPGRTLAEVRARLGEYAVLGYSGAGVVVERHPTVTDLDIGARVAYGGEGTGHAETILAGRNLIAGVPDSVPFEHAAFTTLGAIALHAVRTAAVGLGDTVAVIGLGLVGQLVAQLVRLQGGVVVAIDLRTDRVDLARRLGAHHGVAGQTPVAETIAALTGGRGADCVVVAAASRSADPVRQAVRLCRDRGQLVIVGAVALDLPWLEMYQKEIRLFMSRAYGPGSYDPEYERHGRGYPIAYVRWTENRNMEEFLRLLADDAVHVDPLITHRFALDAAPEAYRTIMDSEAGSLAVLLRYPSAVPAETTPGFAPRRRVPVAAQPHRAGDVQVGLVGAGSLARWVHLPNLKKLPGVALRAVCSTSGARGKSYALRFGAAYCCSDYDEILSDREIDVVLIVTRNQHHAAQALAALGAGKHVFVEKPMALTEAECRALTCAVEESGRQFAVGFNRRFAPFYVQQKAALQRRSGRAVVSCRVNSPAISGSYWMADPAVGGAILGEACHFVDLMYWLLDSEPVSVSAFSLPTGHQGVIGENNLVASFHFADGSIGSLTYCTVGSRTSGGERVEVFAPGIGVAVDGFKRLTVNGTVRRTLRQFWPDKGSATQLGSFFSNVRSGQPPSVTVRDGARATIACLRMLESARTRTPQSIDLEAALGRP